MNVKILMVCVVLAATVAGTAFAAASKFITLQKGDLAYGPAVSVSCTYKGTQMFCNESKGGGPELAISMTNSGGAGRGQFIVYRSVRNSPFKIVYRADR
jgi:hypothetical protein